MYQEVLTPRQLEVLRVMRDNKDTEEGELTQEGLIVYIGPSERTSPGTVNALRWACCIKPVVGNGVGYTVYGITETGEGLLDESLPRNHKR